MKLLFNCSIEKNERKQIHKNFELIRSFIIEPFFYSDCVILIFIPSTSVIFKMPYAIFTAFIAKHIDPTVLNLDSASLKILF